MNLQTVCVAAWNTTLPVERKSASRYVPFYRRRSLAMAVAAALVSGALASHWAERRQDTCLHERLKQYAACGAPVTLADLDRAIPPVADDRNLSLLLYAALETREGYLGLPMTREDMAGLPFLTMGCSQGFEWDDSACRRAEAYLATHADWMAVLERSRTCSGFAPRNFVHAHHFGDITFPHGAALEHGVRCLCLRAFLEAHRGTTVAALESLRAAKALGRKILAEPFVVRVLTAVTCDRVVIRAVRAILDAGGGVDPELAAQFILLLEPLDSRWLGIALRFERLAGLDFYYARDGTVYQDSATSLSYLKSFPDWVALGKVNEYLDYIDGAILALTLSPCDAPWVALAIEAVRERRGYLRNPLLSLGPPILGMVVAYRHYVDDATSARAMVAQAVLTASARIPRCETMAADLPVTDALPATAGAGD
jgi:hypothetical protein